MGQNIGLKSGRKNHDLTLSVHTTNCVCHSIRSTFRVLGIYNFARDLTELDRVLRYGWLTTQVTTVWPHLINSQKGDVEAIKTNIFT